MSLEGSGNNPLGRIGISKETILSINHYVKKHQGNWDQELLTDKKISKFIRHRDSGLPFSIEYLNNGSIIGHTKNLHAHGQNKNIFLSGDINKGILYARAKPITSGGKTKVEKEAAAINSFSGCRGIIQNMHASYYLDKAQSAEKFHYLQELFAGTFDELMQKQLTNEELELVVLDLINGLAAIHSKGLVHDDIKAANIIYQLNDSGKVSKCVLCDLGEITDASNWLPGGFSLIEAQHSEVDQLLNMLGRLYRAQGQTVPAIFRELKTMHEENPWDLPPRDAASASDAAISLKSYFDNI